MAKLESPSPIGVLKAAQPPSNSYIAEELQKQTWRSKDLPQKDLAQKNLAQKDRPDG